MMRVCLFCNINGSMRIAYILYLQIYVQNGSMGLSMYMDL